MNFKNRCRVSRVRLQALLAAAVVLPLFAGPVIASQLIYTPVNPSFGGNPLNGPYLLQKAQANKSFEQPTDNLDFLNGIGIIAQTDTAIIFKKGDSYYSYDIASGVLHVIDFNNAVGAGLDAPIESIK